VVAGVDWLGIMVVLPDMEIPELIPDPEEKDIAPITPGNTDKDGDAATWKNDNTTIITRKIFNTRFIILLPIPE
jgi:hypothetical protein